MKIHIVKKGDTLYLLAQKYNVTLEKVIAANPQLADPNQLSIGEKIKIPTDPVTMETQPSTVYQHKVKQGDSLWKLSKAWNVPLKLIIDANSQLKNPNALLVGETVNIPHYKEEASDFTENKKNTAVKEEMTQPKPESPTKQELTQPKEELTQPKQENMPSPKEEMTQPKETVNPPKLPELKLPEVPMAPVNPAPPQMQPIVTPPAPPQMQPKVTQPIASKPKLPTTVVKQPVAEKFCGCTKSEPMVNSEWSIQQPTFDYSPQINAMPNSWYPGIESPQTWGNAPINTSLAEHASPTVVSDQGYHHDCEHPWCWGPVQTPPINAHPTPYPAYSDCCAPGYYPSHEASENASYPVYPPFIHQGHPQQYPESTVQGSQWSQAWGGPPYGSPAGGHVSDYSQLQGQQSANSPYHPFAHGNAPMYPLEGYTTPYMFMPDCGCREENVQSTPAIPGSQEIGNNLTIASQNEVGSSSKPKDRSVRKGKSKDSSGSTSKEETSKAKVSSKNATNKKQKSRSSSYNARSRKNPWIKD
ncbi:LysM peptidoglycan-binding domain-containing protein [Paenibacillus polymyxa]|uniref:LysM peptidoglycan-binding domain-containing protein n=1 Tax=Paenibacillus polymyxa TaxID=1406 RepID=UPI002AB58B58|nr:LysM peptidoglycan-binding domain-containing protein [Paenibacillus polymyxa]MDY7993627.1 LysM peptidoglycan-binding domain-containing protein [Paenibacillus polymyxa]MDY8120383.1 LysM peptidoglycan-binding domain-containing protein [Paenibacillus polymyxa]